MKKFPVSPQRAGQVGLFSLALLAGCASPPTPPRNNDIQVQQQIGKGYLSEEQFSLRTTPVSWLAEGHSFDFIFSTPVRPGKYPLVIYLPGLGESRMAGELWRTAWAQAGYAVLSIQLLAEDGQAWQSPAARNGDFRALVRERFSGPVMASRQKALRTLIDSLHKHSTDAILENTDLSRIVLAGYDLGAYTVMVAAGEKTKGDLTTSQHLPVAGVIALSPYADFSGPGFETRYSDLTVPVMSVTGAGDIDSYGAVSSATLRTAPFQRMPAGGKYLLSIDDASHELLAGNVMSTTPESGKNRPAERGGNKEGRSREGGRGGSSRGGPGGNEGMGSIMPSGGGNRSAGGQGQNGDVYVQPAIRSVTTAFLDSLIKQDEIAQEWLRRDARRWLRETGSLAVR